MPEPKHISKSLQTGIEKLREYAAKMAEAAPTEEQIQSEKLKVQSEIIGKYLKEINKLHPADRKVWDAWEIKKQADVLELMEKIRENRYFGASVPVIDLTFLVILCSQYNLGHVRSKLRKAYLWLVSNPGKEKKNYRRFIMNFMEDRKYETQ